MLAAGVSTSFVSCVDTEEPDSIVTLRNAKAEEIKAEAKVQEALAGLKDAEAAYKKAEERAKIADAVTTELNNKLLEVQNTLEADKITGKHDLVVAKAKEDAQAELDLAKNEAAVALADYDNNIKIAQLNAKVVLAKLKAEGVTPEGGEQGELLTALENYNEALDDVSTKTLALKKAINNLTTGPAFEKDLQDKVDAKQDALDKLKETQKKFTELAQNADIQELLDAYTTHKKNIAGSEEAKKNYEYKIKDLEEQIKAITKPSEDAEKTYKETKVKDYAFDVPTDLQGDFASLETNDKSILKYDSEKKQLVLKSDDGVENSKLKDGVQAALDILSTKYLNAIKQASDKESTADKKKAYDDKVKEVESNDGSVWKTWDAAVKAYQKADGHTDANKSALEDATEAYLGSKYPLGAGVLVLVKPTLENLKAYYGNDQQAENFFYMATTPFGQLNSLYKAWQDSKKADQATTLQTAINNAVTPVTTKLDELKAAVEKAKADEKVVALENDKAEVEKKKAEYEASIKADEALVEKIEGFSSLKLIGVKKDASDPKNIKWDTEDVSFSQDNLTKYYDNFKKDLDDAKAAFAEDVKEAESELKAAEDQLASYKKALAAQNFDEYYYDYAESSYVANIVKAQAELKTSQADCDAKKAKYEVLVAAYAEN